MRKEFRKFLVIFLAMLFFGSLIVPNLGGAEERGTWVPAFELEIAVSGATMDSAGNYALMAFDIDVTITNTGQTKLSNLNLSLNMSMGAMAYLDEYNDTIDDDPLDIGEDTTVTFHFTNLTGGSGDYSINATMSAMRYSTSTVVGPETEIMNIHIEDMENMVAVSFDLWNMTMMMEPAADGYYSLFQSNMAASFAFENYTLAVQVANDGNKLITDTPIFVNASLYDGTVAHANDMIWSESMNFTGGIGLQSPIDVPFTTYFDFWSGNTTDSKLLTINIESMNINNNNQYTLWYMDEANLEVTEFVNYEAESVYANFTEPVQATLTNTGNWNLTHFSTFTATLTINNGTPWSPSPVTLDAVNLTDWHPGDDLVVDFWLDSAPGWEKNGMLYTMTVDINPTNEFNGTGVADDTLQIINVSLNETMSYDFELTTPTAGEYDINDASGLEFNGMVTNTGTLPVLAGGYHLNLTYKNMDTNEMWTNQSGIQVAGPIAVGQSLETKIDDFDDLTFDYNANFTVYATMSMALGAIDATDSVDLELMGGSDLGTISGTVSGITEDAQVMVKAFAVAGTDPIAMAQTTGTGTDRTYSIDIAGMPAGVEYEVKALEADNYWYADAMATPNPMAMSGRITDEVDLTLVALDTSNINGSVMLMGMAGGPELDPAEDWTEIMVMVEGTPISFNTDLDGNYDNTKVVVGTLNVSASKANFMGAYNDSVVVIAANNTTVDLELVEHWNVMVTPMNGSEVAEDVLIVAKFEEELNKSTVGNSTFYIKEIMDDLNTTRDYNWSADNMTCTITPPAGSIEGGETYTIMLTTDIMNLTDVMVLHRDWETEFMIEPGAGHVEGYVVDKLGAPMAGVMVAIGDINMTTGADGKFLLEDIEPGTKELTATKENYVMAEVDVVVVAGDTVVVTNITLVKVAAPINSYTPDNGATDVPVDTTIEVTFNNEMNASTIDTDNFTLSSPTRADVAGTISTEDNTTFVFTPDEDLDYNTTYTWTLKDTIMEADATESWYFEDAMYTFTTELDGGVTPITVSGQTPANDATDVAVTTTIKATFSMAINQTAFKVTITPAAAGEVTWDTAGTTFTYKPTADLTEDTEYTVTIAVADVLPVDAGESRLAAAVSWKFTTIAPEEFEYEFGPIKDDNGDPVKDAKVVVKDEEGTTVWSGKTDSSGNIKFTETEPLAAGNYTVKVTKSDYEDIDFKFTVDENGDETLDGTIPEMKSTEKADELPIMWILIILVVVIIIIIVAVILMRQKKPAEEEIEGEEEEDLEEEEEFECPECGAVVTKGEGVCPECGAEFEEEEFECPECGAGVEPGTSTCPECGAEFEEEEEEGEEDEEEFEVEDEDMEPGDEEEELEEDEDLEEEDLEEEDLEEEDLEEEDLEDDEELEDEDEFEDEDEDDEELEDDEDEEEVDEEKE